MIEKPKDRFLSSFKSTFESELHTNILNRIKKSQLYLFTSDFPYGTGETFLETEITYLAKGFDEVKIISQNTTSQECRNLPQNCSVQRFDLSVSTIDKMKALFGVLNPLFWKERKVIKTIYQKRISKGIFTTILISLYRAKRVTALVSRLQRENDTNANQTFYSYWCDDVALGLAIARKKNPAIACISRIHRWDVYFEESVYNYLPFRHAITGNLSKIFFISQDGIEYAKLNWKTDMDDKFHLSRLGVSNEFPMKKLERDHFLVVSCSNLIPVKRVHLIAEALQLISEFRIHWVHIGDGPERSRLEKEIVKLPRNISVELKGRIPNPAIYSYYDELRPNLLINVSSSEGVPVSIMEAMSFGIPVIATNVGGNGEIVNRENGYLVDANILPMELAETIKYFVELSTALKDVRQEASFETWNLKYNASGNFSQFVQKIQDL